MSVGRGPRRPTDGSERPYESSGSLASTIDAGIEAFRAALQVSPRMVTAHHNLALAMSDRGNWPAAITILRHAISLLPGEPDLINLRRRLWLRRIRRWVVWPFRRK